MRLLNSLVAASFVIAISACGGEEGEEAFATFADCYVDHAVDEGLAPDEAIAVCCLDHPIGSAGDVNVVCGESALECVDFVDAEVSETDDPELTLEEIEAGCDIYETEH